MSQIGGIDQIKNYWNRESERYKIKQWTGNNIARFDYYQTKKALLRNLKPNKNDRILEVGCGVGIWSKIIAEKCSNLVAIDISKKMIEKAKQHVQVNNIDFKNCDFVDFKSQGKFNKIFSVRVLEYIPNKIKFFYNCSKYLTPNGELVVITKTKNSLWGLYKRLKKFLRFYNKNNSTEVRKYSWYQSLTVRRLKYLLKQCNLSILNYFPVIIRLPIFKRGNDEIPILNKKSETEILRIFENLTNKISLMPKLFQRFIAESLLIHAFKVKTKRIE